MHRIIQAGKFKACCLKLMDEIEKSKRSIIITKHKRPIVKMMPIGKSKPLLFGKMKGTVHFKGDLIQPIAEEWNACQ